MMPRRAGRPREGSPGTTRNAILAAAQESFALSGYSGATTRDVASRAGVNVATLHYHFGTKAALYEAVWEETLAAELIVPAARLEGGERLAQIVGALWDLGAARPALARLTLFHQLARAGEPAGHQSQADPRVALLIQAFSIDEPTGLPPELAAALVLALLDSALLVCAPQASGRRAARKSAVAAARSGVIEAALSLSGLR
jgi:AcrR family transcriptional regulator